MRKLKNQMDSGGGGSIPGAGAAAAAAGGGAAAARALLHGAPDLNVLNVDPPDSIGVLATAAASSAVVVAQIKPREYASTQQVCGATRTSARPHPRIRPPDDRPTRATKAVEAASPAAPFPLLLVLSSPAAARLGHHTLPWCMMPACRRRTRGFA